MVFAVSWKSSTFNLHVNRRISTFCNFYNQKREYDVIFMDNTRLHMIKNSVIRNVRSTSCKMHHSHVVIQNNIIFSFLIMKVTKCWNSTVDTSRKTITRAYTKGKPWLDTSLSTWMWLCHQKHGIRVWKTWKSRNCKQDNHQKFDCKKF